MKKLCLILIISFGFYSCHPGKRLSSSHHETRVSEQQIDTVLYSVPDSASITALLRCDSLGNAYLAEITQLKTGRSTRPEIRIRDNYIHLKCQVDSMAVYMKMYRQFRSTSDSSATVVTVYKDKPKGKFEAFLDKAIYLLIGTLAGAFLFLIFFRK